VEHLKSDLEALGTQITQAEEDAEKERRAAKTVNKQCAELNA
jgi:hypothetical protein